VYEEALCHELNRQGLKFKKQQNVSIKYKNVNLATPLRLDLIVEDKVIIEIKAKEKLSEIDKPQLLTYLKLSQMKLGLLINFNSKILKNDIHRVVNNL
jgi:GxxExxY protein